MQEITMERWWNGGGITLEVKPTIHHVVHPSHRLSLDCDDVDRLHELIHAYKEHPNAWCLTEKCPVHARDGSIARRQDFLCNIVVTAIEGGIGYWADYKNYQWRAENGLLVEATADVLEDTDGPGVAGWQKLDSKVIERGINLIKYKVVGDMMDRRAAIIMAELDNDASDIDSVDADCIVQAGLLGEVKYG